MHTHRLDDVSGIAPTDAPAEFLITAGTGRIECVREADGARPIAVSTPWSWDNHAVFVGNAIG